MIGLIINHTNLSVTQQDVYQFSSFGILNGRIIGIQNGNIKQIDNKDESPSCFFELYSDLKQLSRLRYIYTSGSFNGSLVYSVTSDDNITLLYTVTPANTTFKQHTFKFPVRRDNGKGRYWKIKVSNYNQSVFSIDEMYAYIVSPLYINNKE